jgi:DNA-binding IscR family transcriptional regulator
LGSADEAGEVRMKKLASILEKEDLLKSVPGRGGR